MSLPPDTGSVELIAFREHVIRLLSKGERPDGRAFGQLRLPTVVREVTTSRSGGPNSISSSSSHNNNNSNNRAAATASSSDAATVPQTPKNGLLSSVILQDDGGTCITGTVHAVFGPPWVQRPHEGRLNVHVTAPFLQDLMSASGFTTAGGNSNAAVASGLADYPLRQVEGYVRSVLVSCLDLSQLSIYAAEACWVLTVTLTLINVDGGIRAAALHAAVAALHNLVLPRAQLPNGDVVESRCLRLNCVPVACTYGVMARPAAAGLELLADTSAIEEHVADDTVTVAVDEAGDLVDLQLTGRYPLLPSVLAKLIEQFGTSDDSHAVRRRLTSL